MITKWRRVGTIFQTKVIAYRSSRKSHSKIFYNYPGVENKSTSGSGESKSILTDSELPIELSDFMDTQTKG